MEFYLNEELDMVLNEKEYNILEEEEQEGYKYFNVDVENYEGSLLYLDNYIEKELGIESDLFSMDYREMTSYAYYLTDRNSLEVEYDILEDIKEDGDIADIIVKVTSVSIV